MAALRLGVNVDHVATVRNARGGREPDPVRLAREAWGAGVQGITVHLREDRRHILDEDVARLAVWNAPALNLEIAPTAEMASKAARLAPGACCLVPERREEMTTERGLAVRADDVVLRAVIATLRGSRVSLFIDVHTEHVDAAHALGAGAVEFHTGAWAEAAARGDWQAKAAFLKRLRACAERARGLGLEAHAGHGLTRDNLGPVAALEALQEFNIGHALVADALSLGMASACRRMIAVMAQARAR